MKRLGSGPKDADEIKAHPFLSSINWEDAMSKKLKVPKPPLKKTQKMDIPLEKVYGKGAFDEGMKGQNNLNDWSFVR